MSRIPAVRLAFGHRAEERVALWYQENRGLQVAERNLRYGPLEIDLLLTGPEEWRLVEVRASRRRSPDSLAWTLVGKKRARLRRAARALLTDPNRAIAARHFQIDVALVHWPPGQSPLIEVWERAIEVGVDLAPPGHGIEGRDMGSATTEPA